MEEVEITWDGMAARYFNEKVKIGEVELADDNNARRLERYEEMGCDGERSSQSIEIVENIGCCRRNHSVKIHKIF